jgi:A/G-specific adenine glycosylase
MTKYNLIAMELLAWYDVNKRVLPWRRDFKPYEVWLSEIMLQQTQVVTVVEYFNRFLTAYPTVADLANAEEEDVFKLWEGLGYYSRAKNLLRCARIIKDNYNGEFPDDYRALLDLPGIGPYTAGAIMSIAFQKKIPAVDGNVMRVISRIYASDMDISDSKNRVFFVDRVMELMPDRPRDFNQAMMELGARVCTPKAPACDVCPISNHCKAYGLGIPLSFPVKSKKMVKRHEDVAVVIITDNQRIMAVKRPVEGLLSNLWGFPTVHFDKGSHIENREDSVLEAIDSYLRETFDLRADLISVVEGAKHVFTHRIWDMWIYSYGVDKEQISKFRVEDPEVKWVDVDEMARLAFPTAFKKIFGKIILRIMAMRDCTQNYFVCYTLEKSPSAYKSVKIIQENKAAVCIRKSGNVQVVLDDNKVETRVYNDIVDYLDTQEWNSVITTGAIKEKLIQSGIQVNVREGSYLSKCDSESWITSTSALVVEPLDIQDLDEVVELYKCVFDGFAPLEYMKSKLEVARGRGYVCRSGGKIVSVAQSDFEKEDYALIVGVATHPDHRGKGFGKACFKRLGEDLIGEGKSLYLIYENDIAGRMYHNFGFSDYDRNFHLERIKS